MTEEMLPGRESPGYLLDLLEKDIIYEIILTTLVDNIPNAAPMGMRVRSRKDGKKPDLLVLGVHRTSRTFKGLSQTRKCTVNIISDVRAFPNAALKREIGGYVLEFRDWSGQPILTDADAWIRCNVISISDDAKRPTVVLEPLTLRRNPFHVPKPCTRAWNAILEATILATRTDLYHQSDRLSELFNSLAGLNHLVQRVVLNEDSPYRACMEQITQYVKEQADILSSNE
jgi:hypothetical protein